MTFYSQIKFLRNDVDDIKTFTLPAGETSIAIDSLTFEKITPMNLNSTDGSASNIPLRIHFFTKEKDQQLCAGQDACDVNVVRFIGSELQNGQINWKDCPAAQFNFWCKVMAIDEDDKEFIKEFVTSRSHLKTEVHLKHVMNKEILSMMPKDQEKIDKLRQQHAVNLWKESMADLVIEKLK